MSRLAAMLAKRRAVPAPEPVKPSASEDAHELVESFRAPKPEEPEPAAPSRPLLYRLAAVAQDGGEHPHGRAALGLTLGLLWPEGRAQEVLEQTRRELRETGDERFRDVVLRLELATDIAGADVLDRPLAGVPLAIVDVETTGVDPATAEVVQIAVVHLDLVRGAEPEVAFVSLVRPEGEIPEGAAKVHGITDADVAEAPRWTEVWPRVLRACVGRVPVAYNAPYDYQVLAGELRRMGYGDVPLSLAWGRWLDPLVLAKRVDKFQRGKRLLDVARRRGIVVDAHGAAADAVATGLVLRSLLHDAIVGDHVPRARTDGSVRGYLEWQRGAALREEVDFVAFQTRGGRKDPIDCPWHRLEGVPEPEAARPAPQTATCSSCGAPILWLVTRAGQRIPVDPAELRAVPTAEVTRRREADLTYTHPGRRVHLVAESGETAWGYLDEAGDLVGRESHFATCPNASRHRTAAAQQPPEGDRHA